MPASEWEACLGMLSRPGSPWISCAASSHCPLCVRYSRQTKWGFNAELSLSHHDGECHNMQRMHVPLRLVLIFVLASGFSYSGTLSSKQEARLHPTFRMLLRKSLDADGHLQASRPELAVEQ